MAKSPKGTKKPLKLYALYESAGSEVKRKSRFCPKCGTGFILATHKNRVSCGKCKYTEFKTISK